jgi:hypothetical protein
LVNAAHRRGKGDAHFLKCRQRSHAACSKKKYLLPVAAQREAYRSGDPARIAAAGTTPADTDYVAALALVANAR